MKPEYPSIAGDILGWLEPDEAWLLWQLAQNVPKDGVIVEIGSFLGKSTVCLGDGAKNGNEALVYTVDHHHGSREHYKMLNIPFGEQINTLPQFRENIFRAELKDIVKPIISTSEMAARTFDKEIDLLFIDGSHKHDEVKKDFDMWGSKVKGGRKGILILHDTYFWAGPTRLLAEILWSKPENWDIKIHDYPNMSIFRKVC